MGGSGNRPTTLSKTDSGDDWPQPEVPHWLIQTKITNVDGLRLGSQENGISPLLPFSLFFPGRKTPVPV